MLRKAVRLLPCLAGALLFSGCAVLNTFQTPDVLEPGKAIIGSGVTFPPSRARDSMFPDIPLGHFDLYARMGVLPRVELGARTSGLAAFGADAKFQIVKRPLMAAVNIGGGLGKTEGCAGCNHHKTRTLYGALLIGRSIIGEGAAVLYGGAKITDYSYRKTIIYDDGPNGLFVYEQVLPSLTIGITTRAKEAKLWPILESNTFFFSEERVISFSLGVQLRFGRH